MDDFLADPVVANAKLSPDGRMLAYTQTVKKAVFLMVQDLQGGGPKAVLNLGDQGVSGQWLEWKDNDRLLVGVQVLDIKKSGDFVMSVRFGSFILAVDKDGSHLVQLLKGNFWNPQRGNFVALLDRLKNDPDHILAIAPDALSDVGAWKVSVRTGEAVEVERGSAGVSQWQTDATGAIVVRYRTTERTKVIESRAPGETQWTTVATLHRSDLKQLDNFRLLGAAEKPGQFYVTVNHQAQQLGDQRQLRIYDLKTKALSEPVWPDLQYDIDDIVYDGDTNRLAGVCYTADVAACDLADPEEKAHLKGLSTFFGGERNITPISYSRDRQWRLLRVSGPDEPSSYYLYDRKQARIDLLGEQYDKLPLAALGVMQRYSFPARDGASIPAYLTRPRQAGNGPLPLIVMPHGGPEARDSFVYDSWVQLLATRGYLVFQPNFRGSGGYGPAWAEAGYRQWNGRMADDITDGVKALIASGRADPNRICIFGASYGGYAALYAGATHPELYKCVISWAGISDLAASLRRERDLYGADSDSYLYWTRAIGDLAKDADRLRAASPVAYAAEYGPPVLLIHGLDDEIVSPVQSTIMGDALRKAGRRVQTLFVKDEGHPHWRTEDEKTALTQILKFLDAYLPVATTIAAH